MGKSGLAWSPDTGAGVNTDLPAEVHSVWHDIVAMCTSQINTLETFIIPTL